MRKNCLILMVVLILSLTACIQASLPNNEKDSQTETPLKKGMEESEEKQPVTIASFIDTEGAILGKMLVLMLEENGIEVNDKTQFGTPDIQRKALLGKELDLVIDYTGSGQYYHQVEDNTVFNDPVSGYEKIKKLDKDVNNIIWLTPADANNSEYLSVKKSFAKENNIVTMEDFARYINEGGKAKVIVSASFAEKMEGLLGYEKEYGFKLKENQLITLASGNTAEMLKALVEGTDDINVSLVYGTDGALDKMDLVVIEDPMNIPPVYLPAPVIRGEVLAVYPEIEEILRPVFQSLKLETLQKLNAKVAFEGQEGKTVAEEYLKESGFIK